MVQGAVTDAVTGLLRDVFTIIGLVVVIFYRDWKLALIAMVVFPVAVYPIVKFGRKLRAYSTRTQTSMAELTTILLETITGTRIVKHSIWRNTSGSGSPRKTGDSSESRSNRSGCGRCLIPSWNFWGGGISFIVFYGGYNVIQGGATPGTFFSFLAALLML